VSDGLIARRISAPAAKSSLIIGPVIFYLLNFSFSREFQDLMTRLFGLSEPLHFLHILAIVFVLTLGLMALISYTAKVTAPNAVRENESSPAVDMTPWRYAKIAGILVSVATVGTYIALAQ
jgi:SSS family solute:Na+ symporter